MAAPRLRDYGGLAMPRACETCVPLRYRPDRARADFGQADGYIADKKVRLHYFCVYLPHADGCFAKTYPAEPAEAFRDGHVAAFDFQGTRSSGGSHDLYRAVLDDILDRARSPAYGYASRYPEKLDALAAHGDAARSIDPHETYRAAVAKKHGGKSASGASSRGASDKW